jgi:hypothetical protein
MHLPSVWQEALTRSPGKSATVPNEIQKNLMKLIEDPMSPTAVSFWAKIAATVSEHQSELFFEFFRNAHIIVRFLRDPVIVLHETRDVSLTEDTELHRLPRFCYYLVREAETGIHGIFVDGPQRVVEMDDGRIFGYHSEEEFSDPAEGKVAADSEWLLLNASLRKYISSPPTIVPAFPGYSPYGSTSARKVLDSCSIGVPRMRGR